MAERLRPSAVGLVVACLPLAAVLLACGSEGGKCTVTADCPDRTHCANGRCGYECRIDSDCDFPAIETCDDRGRCVPGGGDSDTDVDTDTDTDTGTSCVDPFVDCNGECVLLDSDPQHCGDCDTVCDVAEEAPVCVAGSCVCDARACTGAADDLCCLVGGSYQCIDTTTDPQHCGGCGAPCDPTRASECSASACTCGLDGACSGAAADRCCEVAADTWECTDTTTSVDHCGGCGSACDLDRAGECVGGGCACGVDGLCDGTATDTCCDTGGGVFRCVDMTRSRPHCGACDTPCGVGENCYQGECQCGCEDDEDCVFRGDGVTCNLAGASDDCDGDLRVEGTCT